MRNPSTVNPGLPSTFFIWSAMISVYIVWGSTYLAIRLAVQTMPPFLMAGVRFLVAGSVLYLVVFGLWIGFTAYTWLLRSTPPPLVSTYAYVNPIVAVLLGYFLAGELLTFRIFIAALMVVSSVALISIKQQGSLCSKEIKTN